MGNIDNFFAELENKYPKKSEQSDTENQEINNYLKLVNNQENKSDIDLVLSDLQKSQKFSSKNDLLTEIETKFQQQKSTSKNKNNSENDLLTEIESKFQQQKKEIKSSQNNLSLSNNSLEDIAQTFARKKAEIKQHQKVDNLEEIRQQELEKQRQEKQIIRKAEIWLKNLDPYSDEGFWFEQFASSYSSKLEAAIEYIKALY